jgi:hypothetical protein
MKVRRKGPDKIVVSYEAEEEAAGLGCGEVVLYVTFGLVVFAFLWGK